MAFPAQPWVLSGAVSQRLRTFCYQMTFTDKDLDAYASLLTNGSLQDVKTDFQNRTIKAEGLDPVRDALANIKYGPTEIPIYGFLLQLTLLCPEYRTRYISIIRYLALEAYVPVDSTDKSGTTALSWSISTKPYFDTDIADILLEAGAKINARNRYGCVAGHDIVMINNPDVEGTKKVCAALKYFVDHGGDINIADGDGVTVKRIGEATAVLVPALKPFLNLPNDGVAVGQAPSAPVKSAKKVGRNELCPCNSKKKFKACCGKN